MKQEQPYSTKIAAGVPVSPGIVTGAVRIVACAADVANVKEGDIMVVSHSSPAFAVGVMKAAGLICQTGGVLTHICIVAREIGIPCVARVSEITTKLSEGDFVTMNASSGEIYAIDNSGSRTL
jgi:pyruvate,water dikinase